MRLTDYVRRIAQRWRIIISTLVLVVAAVGAITFAIAPTYESKARVFVSNSAQIQDIGTQMAAGVYATQKVLSYAAVASSVTMAQVVDNKLDLSLSPDEIADEVTTSVEYGTVLVSLTVTDKDPDRAVQILTAILDNYNDVLKRVDSSKGAIAPVSISVMEYPSVPSGPSSPNVGLNLLAAGFAGLLLGVALAALRDVLDDSIKDAGLVEAAGAPVLGNVPARKSARGLLGRRKDATGLVSYRERGADAEAIRQLRLNIRFASLDRAARSIVITSSMTGEGKSFIAANLASVYAATGLRTVLVDLDLRRPVQAERLGLEQNVGVTSILLGTSTIEDVLQPVSDSAFTLLASGPLPPNPADVLSTQALADLLATLSREFDAVIIDTPPSGMFVDARQLASHVDGVVVVSRRKRTRIGQLMEAIRGLREVGGNVLGVIVNYDVVKDTSAYDYYGDPRYSTVHRARAQSTT